MVKFSKESFWKAKEILEFCVSEDYEPEMSFEEFKALLKRDRKSGLLERSGFRVDLRKNILVDVLDEMED